MRAGLGSTTVFPSLPEFPLRGQRREMPQAFGSGVPTLTSQEKAVKRLWTASLAIGCYEQLRPLGGAKSLPGTNKFLMGN